MKVIDAARGSKFRFVRYVPATDTAREFVEVFGGKRGHEQLRCVHPDRVISAVRKTRRRVA